MNITINKEYENLVPPLSDSEFQALKKSIKIKGMYMPIVISHGIVLDGHHRFKICKELGIEINEGDIIFPLEGDVFFHENDIVLLNEYLEKLKPNEGLQAPYVDFMENQYYVEAAALNNNTIHYRRIAIKFGTWDYYKSIVINFMSQQYPLTMFPKYIFHYAWWRPGKYKQLRVSQLKRDMEYHNNFLAGLELAAQCKDASIVVRPNKPESDPARYICKIDIQHPKEIINHPNYIN